MRTQTFYFEVNIFSHFILITQTGVEPASQAHEASILPLNYSVFDNLNIISKFLKVSKNYFLIISTVIGSLTSS